MSSIYKKMKNTFVDSGLRTPLHNNKYNIHHCRLQKKQRFFHQNYYYIEDDDKDLGKIIGINKKDNKIDGFSYDWCKDSNKL